MQVIPWWVQSFSRHVGGATCLIHSNHARKQLMCQHAQVVGRYGALQNDALARVNGVASEVRMGMGSRIGEGW